MSSCTSQSYLIVSVASVIDNVVDLAILPESDLRTVINNKARQDLLHGGLDEFLWEIDVRHYTMT